jgi:hypothetical protein
MLVGADSADAYLVDLFQVHGGDRHDYLLHGPAAEDSVLTLPELTQAPFEGSLLNPGVTFEYPRGESFSPGHEGGYGFVRDLHAGVPAGDVVINLRLARDSELGVRTILKHVPGMTVVTGQAPRLRQAERNDSQLPRFNAPFFCARVDGAGLNTLFAAVHEPVSGKPLVDSVELTQTDGAVVVTVDRGARGRDYVAVGLDGPVSVTTGTADGVFSLDGQWGLVRVDAAGGVRAMHLVGGTRIALAARELAGSGDVRGTIHATGNGRNDTVGGWFEVSNPVSGNAAGSLLLCTFGDGTVRGYTVVRAVAADRGTRLFIREDPGCELTADSARLTGYPAREIPGDVTFRLLSVAHMRAKD